MSGEDDEIKELDDHNHDADPSVPVTPQEYLISTELIKENEDMEDEDIRAEDMKIETDYVYADQTSQMSSKVPSLLESHDALPSSMEFDDTKLSSRPISKTHGSKITEDDAKAVSASILEASIDDTPDENSVKFQDPGSPALSPPPSPSLLNLGNEVRRQSPMKTEDAMMKTSSQYGDRATPAQSRRDIHLIQQQQRGFFNRRLQQNQLLGHSFPAGFSLQGARRDVGAFDFAIDTRPYAIRNRASSPPQGIPGSPPAPSAAVSSALIFPSHLSKHPSASNTLAGPFVDLGVYGGPAIVSQHNQKHDVHVVNLSISDAGGTPINVSQSIRDWESSNIRKFPVIPSKKAGSSTAKTDSSGLLKGTTAYSQALAKTRVSAITSSHTGSSYTSWMRGAAYEREDYDGAADEEYDDEDDASDPYADCAGPTLTMLRRLRQQQGVQLSADVNGANERSQKAGGWAITGQRLSLTIPTHPQLITSDKQRASHDHDHSILSESMSSAESHFSSLLHHPAEGNQQFTSSSKARFSAPDNYRENKQQQLPSKVYNAPALLPALHPTTIPTGNTFPLLHAPSSPPASAPMLGYRPGYYSPNSSTSAQDSNTLIGALGPPQLQPLMPHTPSVGVVDYSTWVAHQRAERQAHEVWRKKGNDLDSNYSLYHGIMYSGLSASSEKIAWLIEQGIEPGLQPHVLQEMLLHPQAALPEHITLCLFSASQMLKAVPNQAQDRMNSANYLPSSQPNQQPRSADSMMVGVRPGTVVFGESSAMSVTGDASITNYENIASAAQKAVLAVDHAMSHVYVPQGGDANDNLGADRVTSANVDDTDAASYHSHQSLQSLLSNSTELVDDVEGAALNGNAKEDEGEDADGRRKPSKHGRKSRHGSVIGGDHTAIMVAGDLMPIKTEGKAPPVIINDSISGQGMSSSATGMLSSSYGNMSSSSAWLSDGVQRLVPTRSSLRYIQEVIIHDIAEAILTAFPTYHHDILRNRNSNKVFSYIDLQHQRHLARNVEEEYYRLAKDLSQTMKIQIFDHRDHTWRWLRAEADWERGVQNALLFPNTANELTHAAQRIEVMYHLSAEVEAQLKRHLLIHRHENRHEALRYQSSLCMAQAAVTGVLNSLTISAESKSNHPDNEAKLNGELQQESKMSVVSMKDGKQTMSMSANSVGMEVSNALLDTIPQPSERISASRHLNESLASLTTSLDHRVDDKQSRYHQQQMLQQQLHFHQLQGKSGHKKRMTLDPLRVLSPQSNIAATSVNLSQASSVLSSSNASLGSGFQTNTMTYSSVAATATNPLLLSHPTKGIRRSTSSLLQTKSASNERGSSIRTPPLTVVKAPSLLYPQAQHYKVQSMKKHNDDALPKLQAMAESLEQRLLQTRWG